MQSESVTHHASPGDQSLQLDCRFDMPDFSLFDNPIVWRKRQLDDDPLPVNFQGNILPPFFDAKRFATRLMMPERGRYNPALTILGEYQGARATNRGPPTKPRSLSLFKKTIYNANLFTRY